MSTRDLVNAIIAGDALEIESAFNSAISEKLSVGMDAMREDVARGMFGEERLDEYWAKGTVNGKKFQITTHDSYDHATIHKQNPHLSHDEAKAVEGHTYSDDFENGNHHSRSTQNGHKVHVHSHGGYYDSDDTEAQELFKNVRKEETELEDYSLEELQDFMMSEEFEQLNELSKKTLVSYIKKANSNTADNAWRAAGHALGLTKDQIAKNQQIAAHKTMRRMAGVSKATDKLAKEETELDEAIKVSDSSVKHYEKQEGQKARGVKHWMFSKTHPSEFDIDKHGYTMQHGNYSDAKKKAIKVYKNLGHTGEIHLLG